MSETSKNVFGIDLGTTYSCIAQVDEFGKAVILPNLEGQPTTPSVVYFESADNIIVGQSAKNMALADPDRVVEMVKRYMGDADFALDFDGKTYRPEAISSLILRKVVSDASQRLDQEIKDVIITCPAYFGIPEVEATKAAGALAGLNVLMVLREPTAAALAYGLSKEQDKTVLVFDLGGGTFDITLIKIVGNEIKVIATGGDKILGGKDWDELLIQLLASKFEEANPGVESPLDDPYGRQGLTNLAEEMKYALTNKVSDKKMYQHQTGRAMLEVTREELESVTRPKLDRTLEFTRKLIEDVKALGHDRIDQILLVGGSCFMPAVKIAVDEAFGIPSQLYEPNECVAKGAALMGLHLNAKTLIEKLVAEQRGVESLDANAAPITEAEIQQAQQTALDQGVGGNIAHMPAKSLGAILEKTVFNVCSKAFGVKVTNEKTGKEEVDFLIKMNTTVPVEAKETYGTLQDNQKNVAVCIYEQNDQEVFSPDLDANQEISSAAIELPPGLPKGTPIEVTFILNEDGRLSVKAFEPRSQKELKWEIEIAGVLTAQEIKQQRQELSGLKVSG